MYYYIIVLSLFCRDSSYLQNFCFLNIVKRESIFDTQTSVLMVVFLLKYTLFLKQKLYFMTLQTSALDFEFQVYNVQNITDEYIYFSVSR